MMFSTEKETVQHSVAPEVNHPPVAAGLTAQYEYYGEGSSAPPPFQSYPQIDNAQYNIPYTGFPEGHVNPAPPREDADTKRLCGMRRSTALILLCIGALLLIGAIVGGVVGKSSHGASGDQTAANTIASSTSSVSSVGSTAPSTATATATVLAASSRPISASVSFPDGSVGIQLVYQELDSPDIKYRLYLPREQYEAEQNVSLGIRPNLGTGLAATAVADSDGGTEFTLFYLSGQAQVVQATLHCAQNSITCSTTSNNIIVSDTGLIHESSSLAAVYLGQGSTWRVYFQTTSGRIAELDGDHEWNSRVIGGNASVGSSIAATFGTDYTIIVVYASAADGSFMSATYNHPNNAWTHDTPLDTSIGPGMTKTSPFAACYEPVVDVFRVYYVRSDTREIIEYWRYGGGAWNSPDQSDEWKISDAGLGAVCWSDQARLLYLSGGRWAQSLLSNGTWNSTAYLP